MCFEWLCALLSNIMWSDKIPLFTSRLHHWGKSLSHND